MREAYHVKGGGECEYVINIKRGGRVHLRGTVLDIGGAWTVRREEGKYICVCCRHTWLERYIDQCVPERRSWWRTHTAGGRPKEK